jgi:hypothetical protein
MYKGMWTNDDKEPGSLATIETSLPYIDPVYYRELKSFAPKFWEWILSAYQIKPFVPVIQGLPREVYTSPPTGAPISLLDAGRAALLWEEQERNYLREYLTFTSSSKLLNYYEEVLDKARKTHTKVKVPLVSKAVEKSGGRLLERWSRWIVSKPFFTRLSRGRLTPRDKRLMDMLQHAAKCQARTSKEMGGEITTFQAPWDKEDDYAKRPARRGFLRSLSLKHESAGKVRVFAIVDYWTQCALYPLHHWFFKILEKCPMDATHDQEGTLREFVHQDLREVFNFDLKSATDFIPRPLYKVLLESIIGPEFYEHWENLLVGLPYWAPGANARLAGEHYVRYTRGQPMGALSSWASLAMLHHLLVQFAAYQTYRFPCYRYVILGDDISIGDELVAARYEVICGKLGILLSGAKSVNQGRPGAKYRLVTFAAKTYLNGIQVSPISLKDEIACVDSDTRLSFAMKLWEKEWVRTPRIHGSEGKVALRDLVSSMTTSVTKHAVQELVSGRRLEALSPLAQDIFTVLFGPNSQAPAYLLSTEKPPAVYLWILTGLRAPHNYIEGLRGTLVLNEVERALVYEPAVVMAESVRNVFLTRWARKRDATWAMGHIVHEYYDKWAWTVSSLIRAAIPWDPHDVKGNEYLTRPTYTHLYMPQLSSFPLSGEYYSRFNNDFAVNAEQARGNLFQEIMANDFGGVGDAVPATQWLWDDFLEVYLAGHGEAKALVEHAAVLTRAGDELNSDLPTSTPIDFHRLVEAIVAISERIAEMPRLPDFFLKTPDEALKASQKDHRGRPLSGPFTKSLVLVKSLNVLLRHRASDSLGRPLTLDGTARVLSKNNRRKEDLPPVSRRLPKQTQPFSDPRQWLLKPRPRSTETRLMPPAER